MNAFYRNLGFVVSASLGLLLALGTAGCKNEKASAEAAPPERPASPVEVAEAQLMHDVPVYLDEIGKCAAREFVSVVPQVAGRITKIHFVDGADIKVGDPLFTIDPRPLQAALDQAKASLAQAKASLELAKSDFSRFEQITQADARAISKQDFDAKKNAVAVAEAQVQVGAAAVETATLNLEYCTIVSPIEGRAGQRLVDIGNVVKANEGSLLTIQRLDPVYADFTINEGELTSVRGAMAKGTLKAYVREPEESGDGREGELTFLDNSVQDGTGTVKLRATLANTDRHFWPGQFVRVRLVLSRHDVVLVPTSVPQTSQQGSYAFVVKDAPGPGGKPMTVAELRPIVLGQQQGSGLIAIEKGIAAGERVITDGQMTVAPGAPVNILPPASQPAAVAAANADTGTKVK